MEKQGYSAVETFWIFPFPRRGQTRGGCRRYSLEGGRALQDVLQDALDGVPREAVENNLVEDGVDPAILNMDPNEPYEKAPKRSLSPLKEDERFKTFFKMLSMGVPRGAVANKMTKEGVDPCHPGHGPQRALHRTSGGILDEEDSGPLRGPRTNAEGRGRQRNAPLPSHSTGAPSRPGIVHRAKGVERRNVQRGGDRGASPFVRGRGGAALQAYWEAVEALGSLMARMRDELTRSVLVVMGEKHSPKEFEARMRSMVSERDDLYRRLYEGDSLFNPERLPKTNAQGAVGFPDGLCSLVIHDDQPLYAETKPSEWVLYQFAQALLETKPVVEKDAAGADPDAEVVPTTASTFAWKPGRAPLVEDVAHSRRERANSTAPEPRVLHQGAGRRHPRQRHPLRPQGSTPHPGSVLGLANNMDAFRGRTASARRTPRSACPSTPLSIWSPPSGRSTAGHGGRARERRSQKILGQQDAAEHRPGAEKGPVSTLRPYRSQEGRPRATEAVVSRGRVRC